MPSLETLRTKGGLIVTIVIFLALLAFIVGDVAGLFNTRKTPVGEIDGKTVDYMEFYNTSEYVGNIYKMMWGRDAFSSEEQEGIYNEAWNRLIREHLYRPGLSDLGLRVENSEQEDMLTGAFLSPVITQTFTNPQTGMFDPELMKMFLKNAQQDPAARAIWDYLKEQMIDSREMDKYMALVSGGFFVNDLQVENSVAMNAYHYDADVVTKTFVSIPDSLVTVSSGEIRNYYNENKRKFKRQESRDIEYVAFSIIASPEDYAAAEKEVNKMAADFAQADSPMNYATLNSQVRPDTRYYKESALSPELAKLAFGRNAGEMYGPELKGDTYTISRLADTKMMPDTIGAKHILLDRGERSLADSLVTAIRRGSNFTALAQEFSMDQSVVQNGGDLGRFAPEQMVPEFSNALLGSRVGEIITVESQFGLHVAQLTYKSPMVRKAQIATITYKVEPGTATIQDAYQRASNLITAAGGTLEGFQEATKAESLPRRNAHIGNTDRRVSGLSDPRELIRWAYNAKKGDVSTVMEVDGSYVVAALSAVNHAGYVPVEEAAPAIRAELRNRAKADMIAQEMSGKTLQEYAALSGLEVKEAKGIDAAGFFVPSVGMELKLIGAVSSVEPGSFTVPVVGPSGVHSFVVTARHDAQNPLSAEDQRIRLESGNMYGIAERTGQAITEEADIKDMRIRFF